MGAGGLAGFRRHREKPQQEPQELPDGLPQRDLASSGPGEFIFDGVAVPSSLLLEVAPVLRVADEVEASNPRVAHICRSYALEKTQRIDPTSSGPGVAQLKMAFLQRLDKENDPTLKDEHDDASLPSKKQSDVREIYRFYGNYYKTNIQAPKDAAAAGGEADSAELAKAYKTASVLFEVLKACNGKQFGSG